MGTIGALAALFPVLVAFFSLLAGIVGLLQARQNTAAALSAQALAEREKVDAVQANMSRDILAVPPDASTIADELRADNF